MIDKMANDSQVVSVNGLYIGIHIIRVSHDVRQAFGSKKNLWLTRLREFSPQSLED